MLSGALLATLVVHFVQQVAASLTYLFGLKGIDEITGFFRIGDDGNLAQSSSSSPDVDPENSDRLSSGGMCEGKC